MKYLGYIPLIYLALMALFVVAIGWGLGTDRYWIAALGSIGFILGVYFRSAFARGSGER